MAQPPIRRQRNKPIALLELSMEAESIGDSADSDLDGEVGVVGGSARSGAAKWVDEMTKGIANVPSSGDIS